LHKIISIEQLKDNSTVAFYDGVTKWGYFNVLGFAKYKHEKFYPLELTKETRKYWNHNGCFQPEFEQLAPNY
jgi:hypothetical protein